MQRGFSDKDARQRVWPAALTLLFRALGIPYDASGIALAHRFYSASCRHSADPYVHRIEGSAVRLESILPKSQEELDALLPRAGKAGKSQQQRASNGDRARRKFSHQGFDLNVWIAQYGRTFELEAALRSHPANEELFRQERGEGGVHIECSFEEKHTEPGGLGTFVVNASQNGDRGLGFHCCHNSCLTARGDGQRIDRLNFINKMLELGWLTLQDSQNPDFGGGQISARVYHQSRNTRGRDLRVVDKDGTGVDVAVFHANFIAKPDQFDFERLNALCNTQIAPDITAEQLADFISEGRVTVANLIECIAPTDEKSLDDDPYRARLKELVRKKRNGEMSNRDIAEALKAMKAEFGVNKKDAEKDFAKAEEDAAAGHERFGILSEEDTALIEPMRDYCHDFAILNTGGKGVVFNLRQPDLSKALMPRDDFEFLYRKGWIEVPTANGIETIYPAKCFLAKPPKDAQVYHDGLVFKPSGTVKASEYNLYQGMLIEPDESGSCSLLHELIRDVWACGDEETAEWVLEYLMHIIAYPGDKPGTSIAIRGKPGDGKSFVFEKLLSTILGDMVLRVANPRMVLGDFNEAAIAKLAIVLEEAAFAGDKAAFDRLRELVTGDKVPINPKFKAPITVDNFARLIVISNHDHFLHIKPDDRRYTVLESSPVWNGTGKFDQLLAQWGDGGAARFVHEALNHSFRRLDGRNRLVINSNLKTKAAVRQMAQSRSALERCIVQFLLRGELKLLKTGEPIRIDLSAPTETSLKEPGKWAMSRELPIRSEALESAVVRWLWDYDSAAAKHEATLHTIVSTLEKFVGDTAVPPRQKGSKDAATGKRPQLPTVRVLPARKDALLHAWTEGLITDEEYESALPSEGVEGE